MNLLLHLQMKILSLTKKSLNSVGYLTKMIKIIPTQTKPKKKGNQKKVILISEQHQIFFLKIIIIMKKIKKKKKNLNQIKSKEINLI